VNCAEMAEPVYLPFGLWTRVGGRKHEFNRIRQVARMCPHAWKGTLSPSGEYDWTVRLRRRSGLMSNYFDHLLRPPYVIGQAIYIFILSFVVVVLLLFFLA